MRIFGGERVQGLMNSMGLDEDTPIENKLITNTIESAQKKLEASNFAVRKQVLQYDDVMNQQREIIYKERRMVLDGEDISDTLRRHYMNWLCLPTDFQYTVEEKNALKQEDISKMLYDRGMNILEAKEKKYGSQLMRELERICLLKKRGRQVDGPHRQHGPAETGHGPAQLRPARPRGGVPHRRLCHV